MMANTMAFVTYSTTLECDCWYTVSQVAQLVNGDIKDHPELQVSSLPLHHAFHHYWQFLENRKNYSIQYRKSAEVSIAVFGQLKGVNRNYSVKFQKHTLLHKNHTTDDYSDYINDRNINLQNLLKWKHTKNSVSKLLYNSSHSQCQLCGIHTVANLLTGLSPSPIPLHPNQSSNGYGWLLGRIEGCLAWPTARLVCRPTRRTDLCVGSSAEN
jgi:hypothetical protein